MTMNPKVDAYIGRSEKWPELLMAIRPVLLGSGLDEDIKWGKPCYSHGGQNILILQEMKGFLAVMFFKGALLADPEGVLEQQGPNSHSALRMCFTTREDVVRLVDTLKSYVEEAIAVEQAGLQVGPAPEVVFVDELQDRLDDDVTFRQAFEALTPGRRREYNMHLSSAKQAKTRLARLEKCVLKILEGKGFRDR